MSAFASGAESVAAGEVADSRSDLVITTENVAQIAEMRSHLTEEMNRDITDAECVKFLIARKFEMDKAVEMLKKRYEWYNSPFTGFQIDNPSLRPRDMLNAEMNAEKTAIVAPLFPWAIVSVDRDGHPVNFERLGMFASNWPTIHKQVTEDELLIRHIKIVETSSEICRRQSEKLGYRLTKTVVVQDLSKFPYFVEFSGFRFIQRMVKSDEENYPETLKKIFIINAPIYFTAVWTVIKPWLDPVVLSKVEILGTNYLPALLTMIDIEEIPVEFGGKKVVNWTPPANTLLHTA